ncbi:hypothetical protein [Lysinibacillus sp. G4S2]|uniref:hypothetical protein n=1 Tax=Lysinibacillus sp. G4S2 TaxID=3055859 RepID=UPI0025A0E775|nr:hypothetical protein [Lysinibacillus sp. G4S2]MDM5249031.1 hypothetical protein [Lysinibacillus sp. G4S2]
MKSGQNNREYSTRERSKEKRMEEKVVENNNDSPQKLGCGCGTWLIIGVVLMVISLIYGYFGERDYYDPNDWNFDGKVDIKDAEMKLDRSLNNEK